MPLYLSEEIIGTGRVTPRESWNPRRPRGYEQQSGAGMIYLGKTGRSFMWLPEGSSDATLTLISSDKDDTTPAQTRTAIANKLGLTLSSTRSSDLIAEILLTQGKGWDNVLRPTSKNELEFYLGGVKWWSQPSIRGGVTTDTFAVDHDFASNWSNGPGAWGTMQTVGGIARPVNTATDSAAYYTGVSFDSNHYSSITIADAQFFAPGAITRGQAGSSACYEALVLGGQIDLYEIDASLGATLLTQTLFLSFSIGDVIKLDSNGSTHTFYQNGVSRGNANDGTLTGGSPGLSGYDNGDAGADITAWEGPDAAGGGGGTPAAIVRRTRRLALLGVG